ncbi:LysR family transcriptional regulator [Bacillus sp. Marseille-P3661]|uniref:LysR family transcriptional regulator n=1 Tax=Bacillus sp. Marseille-P3661 TaxID=1936234 RepID=UPI000C867D26|nr:LysR family transcriptional regulator [Bacillus sp. Marseille-P3661]
MFESTIHRLRIFQTVVESGSFSAASRRLNITQPSISAHIQALEQELGKSLFIRTPGKKSKLTETGEILYTYAIDVISKTEQFINNIQKLNSKEKSVSVAAQRNIANHLLPNHLASFSRTHPDFEIIMYSQTQDTVINHVLEGKADLGLIMTLGSVEGLYSEILIYEDLEFVVGPSHELATQDNIDPKMLEQYSFVGALKASNHARMIDLALQKIGINNYRMDLQVQDSKSMIEIVKKGVGIATVPTFGVERELETGELISLPLSCEKTAIEIRLIYNPRIKMSDEARLFMVYLRGKISHSIY